MLEAFHGDTVEGDVGIELGIEVEDVVEILDGVGVGGLHESAVDHGEDDLAEVFGACDAPAFEDGFGEVAILFNGVIAEAIGEILS